MIKYIHDDQEFDIDSNLVPENSLLGMIYRNRKDKTQNAVYSLDPNIPYVIYYMIDKPAVSDQKVINVLDYWDVYQSYDTIYAEEKQVKENIHQVKLGNIHVDNCCKLIHMGRFANVYSEQHQYYDKPTDLIFPSPVIETTLDYQTAQTIMKKLDFMFEIASNLGMEIMLAGEYMFKTMMGIYDGGYLPSVDDIQFIGSIHVSEEDHDMFNEFNAKLSEVDLFFINAHPANVDKYINLLVETLRGAIMMYPDVFAKYEETGKSVYHDDPVMIMVERSKHRVTIIVFVELVQVMKVNVVMINYASYSEILHGFDIDCCGIGWDGTDIWATERARFSLYHGYNTINPELTFDKYELLLAKYGIMGMSIRAPNMENYITTSFLSRLSPRIRIRPKHGLSLILYIEMKYNEDVEYKDNLLYLSNYGMHNITNSQSLRYHIEKTDNDWIDLYVEELDVHRWFSEILLDDPVDGDVESYIIRIEQGDVMSQITIPEYVYDVMTSLYDIKFTRVPKFDDIIGVVGMFDRTIETEESLYVGYYVQRYL